MKTEKEFSDCFIELCQHNSAQSDAVKKIATSYWIDMTGHLDTYFTNADRLEITQQAAKLLSEYLKSEAPDQAWPHVVRNFNQHNYWNYRQTSVKPEKVQTEEQKIFRKLFKYLWAFFQSMIILKIAVYYFGLESAANPDQTSVFWVWFFIFISAASLAYFAYRNWDEND